MGIGLLLAGIGARAAYEVGVLRYLYEELGPRLDRELRITAVSTTNFGALNGAYAALGTVDAIERLRSFWESVDLSEVIRPEPASMLGIARALLAGDATTAIEPQLRPMIDRAFPRSELAARTDSGACRIFSVCTSEVGTGVETLYFDAAEGVWLPPLRGARVVPSRITSTHCLASASIPTINPPVSVDGTLQCAGRVRSETIYTPFTYAGVSKVIAVGEPLAASRQTEGSRPPGRLNMMEHVLNTLLYLPVPPTRPFPVFTPSADEPSRTHVQRLLISIEDACLRHFAPGDDFVAFVRRVHPGLSSEVLRGTFSFGTEIHHYITVLNDRALIDERFFEAFAAERPNAEAEVRRLRAQAFDPTHDATRDEPASSPMPLVEVGTVSAAYIRPSLATSELAADFVPARRNSGLLDRFLPPDRSNALMSYLLYDSFYTRTLMDLGYSDARHLEEELANFIVAGPDAGEAYTAGGAHS